MRVILCLEHFYRHILFGVTLQIGQQRVKTCHSARSVVIEFLVVHQQSQCGLVVIQLLSEGLHVCKRFIQIFNSRIKWHFRHFARQLI